MSTMWTPKDPDDILDYQVDWTNRLNGDTIVSASWIVPAGITKGAESNTATTATLWLSGGTHGESYTITSRISTAAGRQMDHSVKLTVQDL